MCLFEPWLVFCLTFVRASSKSTSSSVCFASVMLCSCTFQRSLRGFIKTVEDREIWVIVGLKKSHRIYTQIALDQQFINKINRRKLIYVLICT